MLRVIDTAADITIMGGEMFKKVAAVMKLHNKNFKPAGKVLYNYNKKAFPTSIDGKLELDVCFQNCNITTDVNIKMDASATTVIQRWVLTVKNSYQIFRSLCITTSSSR